MRRHGSMRPASTLVLGPKMDTCFRGVQTAFFTSKIKHLAKTTFLSKIKHLGHFATLHVRLDAAWCLILLVVFGEMDMDTKKRPIKVLYIYIYTLFLLFFTLTPEYMSLCLFLKKPQFY